MRYVAEITRTEYGWLDRLCGMRFWVHVRRIEREGSFGRTIESGFARSLPQAHAKAKTWVLADMAMQALTFEHRFEINV